MATIRAMAATLVGSIAFALAACTDAGPNPVTPGTLSEEAAIAVPKDDLKALVDGNNVFAIDLYKKLAEKEPGNIVISPYSISTALAMTYAGARGKTAEEMAKVLHFRLPPDRLHPAFKGVTQHLRSGRDKSYQLSIANGLWGQKGFPFEASFLELNRQNYGGGFREVDFVGNPDASRQTINKWVEEQTENKIKDLLQKDDIDSLTRLVLTNAIFFRGNWKHPFDKARTQDADFETALGVKVKVPMMSQTEELRWAFHPEFMLLELPYSAGRLTMVVLLPVKRCCLREVETALTADKLSDALSRLKVAKVDVSLPRWRSKSRFELKEPLQVMGMSRPFSEQANFSEITSGTKLRIKDVIHEGAIDVDEMGTIVTAATAAVMNTESASPSFRADHPFLFMIRDAVSGAILFLGKVNDPK